MDSLAKQLWDTRLGRLFGSREQPSDAKAQTQLAVTRAIADESKLMTVKEMFAHDITAWGRMLTGSGMPEKLIVNFSGDIADDFSVRSVAEAIRQQRTQNSIWGTHVQELVFRGETQDEAGFDLVRQLISWCQACTTVDIIDFSPTLPHVVRELTEMHAIHSIRLDLANAPPSEMENVFSSLVADSHCTLRDVHLFGCYVKSASTSNMNLVYSLPHVETISFHDVDCLEKVPIAEGFAVAKNGVVKVVDPQTGAGRYTIHMRRVFRRRFIPRTLRCHDLTRIQRNAHEDGALQLASAE